MLFILVLIHLCIRVHIRLDDEYVWLYLANSLYIIWLITVDARCAPIPKATTVAAATLVVRI